MNHDRTANRLARKFRSTYRRRGVDILSQGRAIEVAVTLGDLYQSVKQLRRSRAPKKYLAVPSYLLPKARKLLKGSGIGIMNTKGRIIKKCRKRRSN